MSNTPLDAPRIRKINREAIFQYIKEHPNATKAEIASVLQLSRPTVARLVDELEDAGLLKSVKSEENTGGRRTMAYSLVADAVLAAGIQLSSMHIRGVIVDLEGNIVCSVRHKEAFHVDEDYRKKVGEVYRELLAVSGLTEERIIGTGVAVHALTDSEGQNVTYYRPAMGSGVEDFSGLLKYIPGKCRLFHDLDALGYNLKNWTSGNLNYISVSPRIGGSILINGSVYHGNRSKPGEFGHIQLERNGPECYCGNRGCFDACCNTRRLRDFAGGDLGDFFEGLAEKKDGYEAFWDEYLDYLAAAVFSIHMIGDAQIVIGGELGGYADYFLQELRDRVDAKSFFPEDHAVEYLTASRDGEYQVAIGAAMYYLQSALEMIGFGKGAITA